MFCLLFLWDILILIWIDGHGTFVLLSPMIPFGKLYFKTVVFPNCSRFFFINIIFDLVSVRVLLFRESDSRGKKLLFDSKSVERRELQPNEGEGKISTVTEICVSVSWEKNIA